MTKIDLITGFLGSGKTTFLKGYVHYLISKGEKVCILEFDYGAINIDMMLLQEFNDLCDLEMVSGGCDYDCHLRRFKTKLIAMGMKKYDRVIVEPSGIFDSDEFFDTLYEEPLDSWYEIGSVISIIDSNLNKNLSEESKYILISQLATSSLAILSKIQIHTKEEIKETIDYLQKVMKEYNLTFDKSKIIQKDFSTFDDNDYKLFSLAGYQNQSHEKKNIIENNKFDSVYFLDAGSSLDKIKEAAKNLFSDPSFGNIIRIKGFIKEIEKWYQFNMTRDELSIQEIKDGQDVIIIIGENLDKNKIKNYFINIK